VIEVSIYHWPMVTVETDGIQKMIRLGFGKGTHTDRLKVSKCENKFSPCSMGRGSLRTLTVFRGSERLFACPFGVLVSPLGCYGGTTNPWPRGSCFGSGSTTLGQNTLSSMTLSVHLYPVFLLKEILMLQLLERTTTITGTLTL
jgi:hypothetical protein